MRRLRRTARKACTNWRLFTVSGAYRQVANQLLQLQCLVWRGFVCSGTALAVTLRFGSRKLIPHFLEASDESPGHRQRNRPPPAGLRVDLSARPLSTVVLASPAARVDPFDDDALATSTRRQARSDVALGRRKNRSGHGDHAAACVDGTRWFDVRADGPTRITTTKAARDKRVSGTADWFYRSIVGSDARCPTAVNVGCSGRA